MARMAQQHLVTDAVRIGVTFSHSGANAESFS